jgi:hypothetical protein
MSKIGKIVLKIVILIWFSSLSDLFGQASEWEKWTTIPCSFPITAVSVDRYGFLYTANELGNIYKYDTTGVVLLDYSAPKKAEITLLEAWRKMNVFVFYRSIQEYVFLDRFLAPSPNGKLKASSIGFARLATPSYDNNLWVIDETDFSLKKYNLLSGIIELSTPMDLLLDPSHYDLNYIREYQNIVFVNDKNSGILLFDNMGNYRTKIPVTGLSMLNFYNDEICFLESNKLKFINSFTFSEREEVLPESDDYTYFAYATSRLYLVTKKGISVYKR